MRRMDPHFAAAFSSEDPDAYKKALKARSRGFQDTADDGSLGVHVPLVPKFLTKLFAGVLILGLVGGGIFFAVRGMGVEGFSIPGGKPMTAGSSAKSSMSTTSRGIATMADPDNALSDKIKPLGDAGKNFFRGGKDE